MNAKTNDTINQDMLFETDTGSCSAVCLETLIRKRAYEIFEARGRVPGHEVDDWRQAEREIKHHLGL